MSAPASIRVVCRFRPQNKIELAQGGCSIVTVPDNQTVSIKGAESNHSFTFDRVYHDKCTQKDVYDDAAKPVIEDIMQGYNGTIFVYGQTSSGKTHTMQGPSFEDQELKGVIPRMINTVFECITKADENIEFMVKASFIEIYMERIRDLLDPVKNNLKIREEKGRGVWVDGTSEVYIYRENDILEVMRTGASNRAIGETKMNAESSRSHSIFILTIQQKNLLKGTTKTGKLYLVDLAGSEKISKTGAQGLTLDEAKMINKSLSSLGNVINALTDGKSTHIPYRDSKLTRVLQESLGGNSRTTLIINCSPSSYNETETVSTLRFGSRAKNIKNKAKINQEMSTAELKELLAKTNLEIDSLKLYIKQLETLGKQDGSGAHSIGNGIDSSYQEKCVSLEKQIYQAEENRKQLEEQIENQIEQIQDKDQEIESQNQSIHSLQNQNSTLTSDNHLLESQLSDLKISLEKSKFRNSEQELLMESLKQHNISMKSELTSLYEKLESLKIKPNINNNNNNNNSSSSTSSTVSSPIVLSPPSSPTLRALNSQNEPKINVSKHEEEWNEKTEQLKLSLQRTPSKSKSALLYGNSNDLDSEINLNSPPNQSSPVIYQDTQLQLENQQLKKKYEELEQVFIKYKLDHHNYSESNGSSINNNGQLLQVEQQSINVSSNSSSTTTDDEQKQNLIENNESSTTRYIGDSELPSEMILQAEQLRKLLTENMEQKNIIELSRQDNLKLKSALNKIDEENRVRMDEELNFLREQTNQKLSEFGVLKEALLCDLENRCQKVIDLELALDEYQDRVVTLSERLKRATKSNSSTDQEVILVQMKLDEVTAVKHQLAIENNNQKIQTEKALHNLSISKEHIKSLEAANQEAQDRYYKLALTKEALNLENNRLKQLINDIHHQKKYNVSPSLNDDQVITGTRIVKVLRGGGGIQGKTDLSKNLYSNTKSIGSSNGLNGVLNPISPLALSNNQQSNPSSPSSTTNPNKDSSFFGLFKKKSSTNLLSPTHNTNNSKDSLKNSASNTPTPSLTINSPPILPVTNNTYTAAVPTVNNSNSNNSLKE